MNIRNPINPMVDEPSTIISIVVLTVWLQRSTYTSKPRDNVNISNQERLVLHQGTTPVSIDVACHIYYRIHGTIKTCQKSQHNYSIPSKLNIHPAISKCRKLLSTASIPIPNVICAVIDRIMVRYLINVLLSSNRAKKDRDVRYSYLQTKSSTYSQ